MELRTLTRQNKPLGSRYRNMNINAGNFDPRVWVAPEVLKSCLGARIVELELVGEVDMESEGLHVAGDLEGVSGAVHENVLGVESYFNF
jgi:hypothetical protein